MITDFERLMTHETVPLSEITDVHLLRVALSQNAWEFAKGWVDSGKFKRRMEVIEARITELQGGASHV